MGETWKLVAHTSGSRLYWLVASLLTTVITARYLGPEGRGLLVAAIGWVTLFSTLGNLSLSQVIVYLAAGRPREEWLGTVLGSSLFLVACITAIEWLIAATLYAGTAGRAFRHLDAGILVLAFLSLPLLLWIDNGNNIAIALGKVTVMNAGQMIGATAALLLTFLAVGVFHAKVHGALVATTLAQAVTITIVLTYLIRLGHRPTVDRGAIRGLLSGAAKLHLNAVGTYLFSQANVLILNHYRKPDETAFFQLATQLMMGVQVIPSAVSTVAYSLVSRKGPDEAWPEHRRLLAIVSGLMCVVALIGAAVAPLAIRLIFGASFAPAVPLFRILLLGTLGMTMSTVMASQWIGRGLFLQAALLTLLIGVLTLIGNYFVVPVYGARGAAWVTVATYGVAIFGNGALAVWIHLRRRSV